MLPIMAPSARIVAYYVTSGSNPELVADSLNFNVEGAFDKNQVLSSFSACKMHQIARDILSKQLRNIYKVIFI